MKSISPQWLHWPEIRRLIAAFGGDNLRFVGGAVRDAVLDRPVSDVDASTPLPPDAVMALLKQHGIKAIPTGIAHGTVTAVVDKRVIEITTLRRDVSTDGRHATVSFTDDWREDAARRDFTMNALYCDAQGTVYDYFNGLDDAQSGHVRFIGDAATRIREDALRILRFFRFHAYYGKGKPDPAGITACKQLAELIQGLSGERIRQEMLKILVAPGANHVMEVMQECNVLAQMLPFKANMQSLKRIHQASATLQVQPDAITCLAALLRAAAMPARDVIEQLHERWKFSRAQLGQLTALSTTKVTLDDLSHKQSAKRLLRVLGYERFMEHALLIAAEFNKPDVLHDLDWAKNWEIPVFPVTGEDLIRAGTPQGKQLGELLSQLEIRWEASEYRLTADELLLGAVKPGNDKNV